MASPSLSRSHRLFKDTGELHPNPREAQRQRREHALDRQRTTRSALFDLSRSATSDLDDSLEELEIDEEPVASPEVTMADAAAPRPGPPKTNKRRLRWQKRFANKLQHAETLLDPSSPSNETPGLPSDLDSSWLAVIAPRGKRCLALVLSNATTQGDGIASAHGPPNTLLLSRTAGRPITRRYTSLPPNTILDCIYDAASSLLWILDALEWAGLPLSGSTAEMRRFWRDAKVAELPPQVLGDPRDRRLLVAAAPASDNVREMIAAAASGAPLCVKVPVVRLTYPDVDPPAAEADEGMEMDDTAPTSSPVARPGVLEVPVDIDGALLYLREALYESGSSCLAGWLPLEGGALAAAAAQLLVEGETGMTT